MAASPETFSSHYVTLEECLKTEEETGERHDWENGQIYNMAGASYARNTVVGNIMREFGNQLAGKSCQPFSNDLRVTIPKIKRRTYDWPKAIGESRYMKNRTKSSSLRSTRAAFH